MITEKGIAYFLNRLTNNTIQPIDSIVLGTGNKTPSKNDTSLTNQTLSKKCQSKVDLKNKRIILTTNLTANELQGINEIGCTTNGELLTHDLITNTPSSITSNINLDYIINLENTCNRNGWTLYSGNIYYIYEPDNVIGVTEKDSENGYHKKTSTTNMTSGSYYYDYSRNILYIQTTDNTTPNNKTIQVITK